MTGGAGAIGSNVTRALAELGANVVVLDDLSSAARWNIPDLPNVLFVEGSVVDDSALKRVFFERPAVVFHMAAFFANQNSVDYPTRDLETNGLGTLKALEYATLSGVDRFVYASSGASFYGDNPEYPLREGAMSLRLSTPYQITKMAGELYANFFRQHHGLSVVKPRLFNSYGPGELPGRDRPSLFGKGWHVVLNRGVKIQGTPFHQYPKRRRRNRFRNAPDAEARQRRDMHLMC